VRHAFTLMLVWALSPVASLLNAALLGLVLLIAGADPHQPLFWLPIGLFLAVALSYDIAALVMQRRKGLSSTEVAAAVLERLWPSRAREEVAPTAKDDELLEQEPREAPEPEPETSEERRSA
jgi:hypothetical protein